VGAEGGPYLVKFAILLATALLSLAIEVERRRTTPQAQQQLGDRPTQTYLQRFRQTILYRLLVRLFEAAALLATLGSALLAFCGPFWPTEPEIEAHDTINASSFVLPFKIINRSVLFPQNNIRISCDIDLAYFVDANNFPIHIRGVVLDTPPISIGRASVNNYACSASQYIRVNDRGFLEIGFEHNTRIENRRFVLHRALTLLKMCVWISGFYNVLGFGRPFYSKMFQWPVMPGQNQWIEGPIIPDLPNEAWTFGERFAPGARNAPDTNSNPVSLTSS
jgi:hypothetical protein